MGDAPAFATNREEIDRVAVEQLELTHGAADQLGVRHNHRLHDADLVARRVDFVALTLASKLQLLQSDDAF